MIFGKSKAQEYQDYLDRQEKLKEIRTTFAIFPVKLETGEYIWLEEYQYNYDLFSQYWPPYLRRFKC